jgi:GNAT superfamily N-acetyltransferase
MQPEGLRALYDQDQRFNVTYPDTRREVVNDVIVRHVQTTGRQLGWILWSHLDADTADTVIDEQLAYFKGLGREFEWKVFSHDQPADLTARLAARGFELREPADAIMVLDMHALPDVLTQPIPASIRRITDPGEIPAAMTVLADVWGEDFTPLGDELASQMRLTPDVLSLYAAFIDGRAVSVAWGQTMRDSQFVGLWGGSTLPDYRKQGLYTGLLAVRAREAQARGRRFLTVDASPMSRPILERFGFVTIAMATACIWTPAS